VSGSKCGECSLQCASDCGIQLSNARFVAAYRGLAGSLPQVVLMHMLQQLLLDAITVCS
jgi:hypothetical protein